MVSKSNFTALLELNCKVDHWHHKGVPFGSEHQKDGCIFKTNYLDKETLITVTWKKHDNYTRNFKSTCLFPNIYHDYSNFCRKDKRKCTRLLNTILE